jgi:hypothetical protein
MRQRGGVERTRKTTRWGVAAAIPLAVLTLLAGSGAFSASAGVPATDGTVVSHWNQVAVTTLMAFPPPDGGAAPALQINLGMVQGAVYDAVNAIGPKQHQQYLLNKRTGARASADAAAATAAYDVLVAIVTSAPERAPFPGRAGLLTSLSNELASSLAAIHAGTYKRQGVSIGHAAAKAMLRARRNDGRFGPSQWVPDASPGHWSPVLNPAGQPILDPTPWVGGVKPFMLKSASQFRSTPPPALDSAEYATELNEVKALGRATGSTRTDDQTFIARWWQSAPGISWNDVARQLIARNGVNAADSARLLALLNMGGADASINCWNDKYHFDFWRPWNAIPRAAEDGNPATTADASWTPLISSPYPEWVSGHNCQDGAEVSALRLFFGDTPGRFSITSFSTQFPTPPASMVRSFDTFSQPMAELIEARIWAGLHIRSSDVAGQVLGNNVARYANAHFFLPVSH